MYLKYLQVISILSKKGRCERASIDEVYLDLTEATETMLAEHPNGILDLINEEALKSHVLGLRLVGSYASIFFSCGFNCVVSVYDHSALIVSFTFK